MPPTPSRPGSARLRRRVLGTAALTFGNETPPTNIDPQRTHTAARVWLLQVYNKHPSLVNLPFLGGRLVSVLPESAAGGAAAAECVVRRSLSCRCRPAGTAAAPGCAQQVQHRAACTAPGGLQRAAYTCSGGGGGERRVAGWPTSPRALAPAARRAAAFEIAAPPRAPASREHCRRPQSASTGARAPTSSPARHPEPRSGQIGSRGLRSSSSHAELDKGAVL